MQNLYNQSAVSTSNANWNQENSVITSALDAK